MVIQIETRIGGNTGVVDDIVPDQVDGWIEANHARNRYGELGFDSGEVA